MTTLVLSASAAPDIQRAAELLRCGRLVAFPTETVYGLGARADDAEAVAALVRVKVRPAEKRLTILIPDPEHCRRYAAPLDPKAAALAKAFWPGPLTLVVPDGSGGDVGLRCPDCEVTRRLLRAAGVPVVAPSANLSGLPPARTAGEVLAAFDGRIAAVLDGGSTRIGLPSTVVQVRAQEVRILRAGALREEDVQAALAR